MSERVRARVVVTGRVQGVFYRATCRDEASERKLCGWVRNSPDGRVEAVFEGPRSEVEDMIAWCRKGPPSAMVTEISVAWESPRGETGFRIMY
ncbi:MAG: acylphosphatase [Planctomycetes bacterium]|nr:acylphosphatase [Planctomycetota bacterium]